LPHFYGFVRDEDDRYSHRFHSEDEEEQERCGICNRRAKFAPIKYEVVLFGKRYRGMDLWQSFKWDKALPCPVEELKDERRGRLWIERHGKDGVQRNGKDERASYLAGATCKYRTNVYHGMFHYKFRLMVCLAKKLASMRRSSSISDPVKTVMADEDFLETEFQRLERLLDLVNHLMLEDDSKNIDNDMVVWSEDEDPAPRSRDIRGFMGNGGLSQTSSSSRRRSRGWDPYNRDVSDEEEEVFGNVGGEEDDSF